MLHRMKAWFTFLASMLVLVLIEVSIFHILLFANDMILFYDVREQLLYFIMVLNCFEAVGSKVNLKE